MNPERDVKCEEPFEYEGQPFSLPESLGSTEVLQALIEVKKEPVETPTVELTSPMDPERELKSEEPFEFPDTDFRPPGSLDEETAQDLPGHSKEVKEEPVETPTVELTSPEQIEFGNYDNVDVGQTSSQLLQRHDVISAMGSLNIDELLQEEEAYAMDAPWAHSVSYDRDS